MSNKLIKLKQLREDNDLSQSALASKLGIPQTTYSNYEIGVSEPDIELLKKLAKFFNVSIDFLVGYNHKEINLVKPKEIKTLTQAQKFLDDHNFTSYIKDLSEDKIISLAQTIFVIINSFNK